MAEPIIIPKIKVLQPQQTTQAEAHAYVPEPPVEPKEEKLIGNMNSSEFTELMIDIIVQTGQAQNTLNTPSPEQPENTTPIGKVLGTIGDVAHGVVDITEGVVRGAVDIVTFGKARRR